MRYLNQTRYRFPLLVIMLLSALAGVLFTPALSAHEFPSVYDTVAAIRERLANSYPLEELNKLTVEQIVGLLTPDEREILGTGHIRFEVNVPVRVYVMVDHKFTEKAPLDPFWLDDRGFSKTEFIVRCDGDRFAVFIREFPAGVIGLGVNSLSGDNRHYFVALEPVEAGKTVQVLNIYPAYQTVAVLDAGVSAYCDADPAPITFIPPELKGLTLLQIDPWRQRDARLSCIYTETKYPATSTPDQIVLTWSGNPQTTQTVQWRTDTNVLSGVVAYMEKQTGETLDIAKCTVVEAETKELHTPRVLNDQRVNRHTATLKGLKPDTAYVFGVAESVDKIKEESGSFTTAPDTVKPFSFIYMGDPQVGFDRWSELLKKAEQQRPNAAFCIIAGDLVNRGSDRDDWDDLFFGADDYFTRRPIVPVIGNHEYHLSNGKLLYNDIFCLLKNGPDTVPAQHAYSFEYSNALFVILDSNQAPRDQVAWLDKTLGDSQALWKFVSFHHPIYSSSPKRDNPIHRAKWMPVFDKHHVDMVLQGHDHAYLRTFPMKNNERVESPSEGTLYVVSVSGSKMYDLGTFDYAEKSFADTSTYQALDIEIAGNRLTYKAYNAEGNCVDEIVIEK